MKGPYGLVLAHPSPTPEAAVRFFGVAVNCQKILVMYYNKFNAHELVSKTS